MTTTVDTLRLAKHAAKITRNLSFEWSGYRRHVELHRPTPKGSGNARNSDPLTEYFDNLQEGPGVWKWRHYFPIYHETFARFQDKPVNVLEIGIYSGGSLQMWQRYFGTDCRIFGVDIMPECKSYETDRIKVFIGDQANREFWRGLRQETPPMDIIIDDGGHDVSQQIPTFEELMPHLAPGGVYLCEDIIGPDNPFLAYLSGFARNLHAGFFTQDFDNPERRQVSPATKIQAEIEAICFYPYVAVVKKRQHALCELSSAKRGSEWQPFAR